ncbi:MAG: pyridoxamine 5'-phosphate oxidase family protein [Eubacteriales bacterium]|jgi:nitroimidazol reductase NimA-like FMN-containing flavoprotein (pyridoxamine 5'-phosphate oxidase superfamily)|nr:pyridoxamine 5'-phosphate oxidase family protein [Eubacteriales bacterium]
MRRKDHEINDYTEIIKIISRCAVCRIAMADNGIPYIIPMNFGYEAANNKLTLFFHSAAEGKKIDILRKNNIVCFEADCGHRLIEGESACGYGYRYQSVIGEGIAAFITDTGEKQRALSLILKHQTGKSFCPGEIPADNLTVFKITVNTISGKKC